MPTWVIALLAVALALVVMLALNGRRVARMQAAGGAYAALPATPLPRSLAAGSERLLDRATLPVERPADSFGAMPDASYPAAPPARSTGAFAAAYAPVSRATAMPTGARAGSEGGGARRFPTEPMPGAPMPGGGGATIVGSGRQIASGGPALVYDAGSGGGGNGLGDDKGGGMDNAAIRASLIRNRPMVVAQGEILPATLETPVSSTRPGPIRAIVARDVRGFDGTRVLIPRGSRLIGDYCADPAAGRRRVLATWTRLIRPDGVAIRIDSPTADAVGGAGMPGRIDTHFLARFANAALQSALQIGVNLASRAGNGSVIVANTPQVTGVMGQNIIPGADEPPTVSVRAGAAISVFVARDLDFAGVPAAR